jgi:predicted Zn-dependent peptidase
MSKRITHTYDNGLRIIYEKSKVSTPIMAYHILCNFGSNNEPNEELYGSAHFIEHLVFKGSKKYKTLMISEYFDKIGAMFNAFTTKKYTAYYTTCADTYVEHTLLLFAEMLLHAQMKNGPQYEKEKNVVTEEILTKQNNPINPVIEEMERLIYNGTPYSKPIDSHAFHKSKHHLPHKKVVELYHQYYIPSNMIISVVSNQSFAQIKKLIDKTAFNHPLTGTSKLRIETLIDSSTVTSPISTIYKPNHGNLLLCIGFQIDDYLNLTDYYSLKLLELILSGLKSSKIFTILREKNGLIYGSSVFVDANESGANGSFIILCQLHPEHLLPKKGVLGLLFNILENLVKHGVTAQELKIAKGNMKGQLMSQMHNIGGISFLNALDTLYDCDKCVSLDQQYDKFYAKISVQQMHDVIRKYITRNSMKIVVLGGQKSYPKLESFIANHLRIP